MTKDDKEIVPAIAQALAGRVGKEQFEIWFCSRVQLELAAGTLRVLAPDGFTQQRLRERFRMEIQAAAVEVLGAAPSLEFAVQPVAAPTDAPTDAPANAAPRILAFPLSAAGSARESAPSAHPAQAAPAPAAASASRPSRREYASLEDFVVGDCNRVAHAAALAVSRQTAHASPLTLYGPTGSGKTHLLEGVWRNTRKAAPMRRCVILSAEQFTTQFVEALQGAGLPSFRKKYRDVDLLILDDLQFLANKRHTLVELQHTIDTLLASGKQLVFACDRDPAEIAGMGQELVARLRGGLMAGLELPDGETRLGILRRFAERRSAHAPDDVLAWTAAQLEGDARQLAGAVNRLHATSLALGREITLAFAQEHLADLIRVCRRIVRLPDIVTAVCDVFGLEHESLHSSGKAACFSHPRMIAMWLARKHTRAPLSEIGRYFGRRSHTTVISAETKVADWLTSGKQIQLPHGSCTVAEALKRVESQLRAV